MSGNGSSSSTGGGIFRDDDARGRGLEGVVKGFALVRELDDRSRGSVSRPESAGWSSLSLSLCLPLPLFLTGEKGLEVMAGASVFTARCFEVDRRREDVEGRCELRGDARRRSSGRDLADVDAVLACFESFLYSLYLSAGRDNECVLVLLARHKNTYLCRVCP